ncbi:MAG: hypothetical protein AAGI25_09085 [Bacteroidota bacterium]
MRTILSIINSELRQRLFSWISLIFYLMLIFQIIWYTKGGFDFFANEQVLMNAPSIVYRNFAAMGMLMIIIIAIATGGVLYKDIQYKSAQWTYAMPINEKQFFVGRFLAAFIYLVIISTGMILGHVLLPYSGIGEADQFGPTPWGQMFHGWFMFTVPNLFVYVALVFFSIVFTRRIATSYLAVFIVIIVFLIAQTSYDTGGGNNLLAYLLVDPGGYVAAQNYTELQTPLQKNTDYFLFTGYILQNRLLWIGIALVLSIAAYMKFSFKYFIQAGVDKSKKIKDENENFINISSIQLPQIARHFRVSDFLKKLWTLSRLEFLNIVRPTSFKIILAIILLMVFFQNVTWNATYYIGKEVPISSNMTFFRLQWGVFVTMLIMIWAGELFFKDKTVNIWQITDTLPVPLWVSQLSRFVAVIGLSFVLSLCFIAVSLLTQVLLGGAAYIDLSRFAEDLLLHKWAFLTFVLYTAIVFFVAGLTSHRIVTHIISIGFFLFLIISFDMEIIEDLRFGYALPPGVEDFSETSGYGIFHPASIWFFLLWLALAIVLIMAGIWLWKRGSEKKWGHRLSFKNAQLNPVSKLAMLICFFAFFFLMSFISRSVYDNGNFTPSSEEEQLAGEYEKKYKYISQKAQPQYAEVDLSIALFPSRRQAIYSSEIILSNVHGVDTLFLNWKDFVTVKSMKLNGQLLDPVMRDEEQNINAYLIPDDFLADSSISLSLEAEKQYIGFTQSDYQADLTFKGSFASVRDFLPIIGYDEDEELNENRKREEQGLSRLSSRMALANDPIAKNQDVFAPDAGLVTGSITVSTEADQIPFAAGEMTSREVKEGRMIATYEIVTPTVFNWHIGSSEYTLIDGKSNNLEYTIFHKPSHTFNIDLYQDALSKATFFLQKFFGSKAVKNKIQLVEIHRWQDPSYSFANTIAISEKEGWVADTKGLQEKAFIYQTVSSGLVSLWVQQNLRIANVQGADMLSRALPEAIALQFVRETFGEEAVQLLIKKKMDKYAKDRNNEPNAEPILLYADGADYLEVNKGAVALYELIEAIGMETFASELSDFIHQTNDEYIYFQSLYTKLSSGIESKSKRDIAKKFEEVI